MLRSAAGDNYIVISPVKDEEPYLETTIQAVLRQTVRPSRWIIVDDGSRDNSRRIAEDYSRRFPWITVLKQERDTNRQPGSAVIRAFSAGYDLVRDTSFDFIVKLDADLDLPADYFEQLIAKFHEDRTLGIASGVYLEKRNSQWLPVKMPDYHAAGASKVIRARCFKEMGGFIPSPGWDTIDEIKAQMTGWKTRHFKELKLHHLKNEGSGLGRLRTNRMLGEIYYRTGGGKLFFLAKVAHRAVFGKPVLFGGILQLLGFLSAWISRRPMLVSEAEARFYRQLLNARIADQIARMLDRPKWKRKVWRCT